MTGNPLYNPTVSSDYIYHYGIKGMKWGIRRTAEQLGHKIKSKFSRKKSSSDESGSQTSSKKIQGSVTVKGTKQNPGTTRTSDGSSLEERKQKVLESRSAKELYNNADLFTTQELQQAYNRLVLEKNIKNLSPKEVSKGQQMLNKYVDTAENISKFLNSTNKVLSQVTRFKNLVEGKGNAKKKDKKDKKEKGRAYGKAGRKLAVARCGGFLSGPSCRLLPGVSLAQDPVEETCVRLRGGLRLSGGGGRIPLPDPEDPGRAGGRALESRQGAVPYPVRRRGGQ